MVYFTFLLNIDTNGLREDQEDTYIIKTNIWKESQFLERNRLNFKKTKNKIWNNYQMERLSN